MVQFDLCILIRLDGIEQLGDPNSFQIFNLHPASWVGVSHSKNNKNFRYLKCRNPEPYKISKAILGVEKKTSRIHKPAIHTA